MDQSLTANEQVTDLYAPIKTDCPAESLVRFSDPLQPTLGQAGSDYMIGRSAKIQPQWVKYLQQNTDSKKLGYPMEALAASFPKVGIAFSGGGLRAALFSVGAMTALSEGQNRIVGGLLQATSCVRIFTMQMCFNKFVSLDICPVSVAAAGLSPLPL